jgi:hypothetical protein
MQNQVISVHNQRLSIIDGSARHFTLRAVGLVSGKDSVSETVHHVVIEVDPAAHGPLLMISIAFHASPSHPCAIGHRVTISRFTLRVVGLCWAGKDSVPETVHHVVIEVDPAAYGPLLRSDQARLVATDAVHLANFREPREAQSDLIKRWEVMRRRMRMMMMVMMKFVAVVTAANVEQCMILPPIRIGLTALIRSA